MFIMLLLDIIWDDEDCCGSGSKLTLKRRPLDLRDNHSAAVDAATITGDDGGHSAGKDHHSVIEVGGIDRNHLLEQH